MTDGPIPFLAREPRTAPGWGPGRLPSVVVAVALLVLLPGCATGGGGETTGSSTFSENLGRLLLPPFKEAMDRLVINRYQYALRREDEQFTSVHYQMQWKADVPTPLERGRGVTDARHRVVFDGRRLETDPGSGGGIYRMTLNAEYQVRSETNPDWHPAPIPEGLRRELERMARDLELEVRSGIR